MALYVAKNPLRTLPEQEASGGNDVLSQCGGRGDSATRQQCRAAGDGRADNEQRRDGETGLPVQSGEKVAKSARAGVAVAESDLIGRWFIFLPAVVRTSIGAGDELHIHLQGRFAPVAHRDGEEFIFAGAYGEEVDGQKAPNQHVPMDKRGAVEGQQGCA